MNPLNMNYKTLSERQQKKMEGVYILTATSPVLPSQKRREKGEKNFRTVLVKSRSTHLVSPWVGLGHLPVSKAGPFLAPPASPHNFDGLFTCCPRRLRLLPVASVFRHRRPVLRLLLSPGAAVRAGRSNVKWRVEALFSFQTKGNRYVPSFMQSAFVDQPDEEKNDDWPVRKKRTKDLTVDRFLTKYQNKTMKTSNQECSQWHKCSRLDSNFCATTTGGLKHGWPFPMKGNRYVPSFMLSAFVEEHGEEKNNDYRHVRKGQINDMAVDKSLEELEELNQDSKEWNKHYSLAENLIDKFEGMLRELSVDRNQIMTAKKFALDNADSAEEIVDALTKSFATKGTPVRIMIARLTLLSNILYSKDLTYQAKFQALLPCIMHNLHDFCCSINGNLVAETLKETVLQFLHDWGSWSVYSNEYLNSLQDIFLGSGH